MAIDLWGYDANSGLATLSVSCSPTRIYDLSWTQPGRTYAGVVRSVPPVGSTCTFTLTNKAGQSVSHTFHHDPNLCRGDGGGRPGGDHPDDTHSAASGPIPAGDFFPLPEGARFPARVAILGRGAAHNLWLMVLGLGEPAILIEEDFDPVATAAQYPVLLIPSGGLHGLESSPSFRARLEEYARRGGTIVAFSQQRGYEYSALPGGQVGGYGWSEDNSCFAASLYLSQWHPILSGFQRPVLDAHVDGYFTTIPKDAQVLLSRRANGMPAAILYPYGEGYVFATTIYDDWGTANGQSSADARTLLRDLLAWAIDDEGEPEGGLPHFAPGAPITLTIPITNHTPYTVTAVALRVVNPDRQVVLTPTVPITLAPGQSAAIGQTLPPATTPGIWRLDASLLAASGYPLTAYAQVRRFVVAEPAEPVDLAPELSLNITAPAEHFVVNTETTFTFIVRNRSPLTQTVELQYWLPHHKWETGDASYGDAGAPNRQTLTVAPHGEAIYHWPRIIRAREDRLWARLVRNGRIVARSHFAVYGQRGSVHLTADLQPTPVQRTETVSLTLGYVRRGDESPVTATFHIRAVDAAGTLFHTATLTAPVPTRRPAQITHPIVIPPSAAAGSGLVRIEVRTPDGNVAGGAFAAFSVPASPLASSLLPPPPLEGERVAPLGLVVTNTSSSLGVERGLLTLTLTTPTGAIPPTASTPFTLAPSSSTVLTLPLELPPLRWGVYTLTLSMADEYGQWHADIPWSTPPSGEGRLDRPTHRARGVAHLETVLVNPGPFNLPLTATLQSAITNLQSPLTLSPRATLTTTWDVPIPGDVAAGRYPFTLTLTLPGGDEWARRVAVVEIPPPALDVAVASRSVAAGETLPITITNTGGADTRADFALRIVDARWQTVISTTVADASIQAGESLAVPLALPDQAASGHYTLLGTVTDHTTGALQNLFVPLRVAGTAAELAVATDRPEYLTSDVLTLTAVITNGLFPIEGGTLTWRVTQPAGFPHPVEPEFTTYTLEHLGMDWQVETLAVDGQGNIWIATGEGAAVRLASGEWVTYTMDNSGLNSPYVTDIAPDGAGNIWFATIPYWDDERQEWAGGGLSVRLADGTWITSTAENSGLLSNWTGALAVDGQGNVWVATDEGVSVRLASGEWVTYTPENSGLIGPYVNDLVVDGQGNVWFAGEGVVTVRLASGEWVPYTMDNSGLNSPYVTDIASDGVGNIWFATAPYWDDERQEWAGGGLSARLVSGNWVAYTTANSDLPSDNVYEVAVDGEGNVWVAGDWSGLSVRLPDGSWRQYGSAHGLTDPVTAIAIAPDGARWVGTSGRILALRGPLVTFSPWQSYREPFARDDIDEITAIAVDPAGNRWFAAVHRGEGDTAYLYRLTADGSAWETFFADYARWEDLAVDGTGTAWLVDGGVAARDAMGNWTWYTPESTGGGLVSGSVHAVTLDRQSNVWFAAIPSWEEGEYVGGGVSVRLTDGTWISYTTGNSGLPSNDVRALAVDGQGNAWFATGDLCWECNGEGVSVRRADGNWITYTTANSPLPSDDVRALTVDNAGNVWLAIAPHDYWDEESQQWIHRLLHPPPLHHPGRAAPSGLHSGRSGGPRPHLRCRGRDL